MRGSVGSVGRLGIVSVLSYVHLIFLYSVACVVLMCVEGSSSGVRTMDVVRAVVRCGCGCGCGVVLCWGWMDRMDRVDSVLWVAMKTCWIGLFEHALCGWLVVCLRD